MITEKMREDGTQVLSGGATACHATGLWSQWYELHMSDRVCTFTMGGSRHLGRCCQHGKFIGFSEPALTPNYFIQIQGPSGKTLEVDMAESGVRVYDSMDKAEKEAGYTWMSRWIRPKQLTTGYVYNKGRGHFELQKKRLEEAEVEYADHIKENGEQPDDREEILRKQRNDLRKSPKPKTQSTPKPKEGFLL